MALELSSPSRPSLLPHRVGDSDGDSPASASASASASKAPSTGSGLLDHIEVISVDISDDEGDSLVAPFEVLVKRDATRCVPTPTDSSQHNADYKLRTSAVVDLYSCSDNGNDNDCSGHDDSSDNDAVQSRRDDAGRRWKRKKKLRSSSSASHRYHVLSLRNTSKLVNADIASNNSNNGHCYSRSSRDSYGATLGRFKRRKVCHSDERTSVYVNGDGDTHIAGPDATDSDTADSTATQSDGVPSNIPSDVPSDVPSDGTDDDPDYDLDDDVDIDVDDVDADGGDDYENAYGALTSEQARDVVLHDVQALEAREPWRFVYRCLDVPFETDRTTDAFDVSFERWDAFWHDYGRAVWERYYWAPLRVGSPEYRRRRYRQWRAAQAFRALAAELCERLGPDALEPLARRVHDGWCYRTAPLVLRELFAIDRRTYAAYMALHRERFPRGVRFERALAADWCVDDALRSATQQMQTRNATVYKAWQDIASSSESDCDSESSNDSE